MRLLRCLPETLWSGLRWTYGGLCQYSCQQDEHPANPSGTSRLQSRRLVPPAEEDNHNQPDSISPFCLIVCSIVSHPVWVCELKYRLRCLLIWASITPVDTVSTGVFFRLAHSCLFIMETHLHPPTFKI